MSTLTFQATRLAAWLGERILPSRLTIDGAANLRGGPTLYVVNHFTRVETFLVPYAVLKTTGRYPSSLAYHTLFHGLLGMYLRRMHVVSTQYPQRNALIMSDLLTGRRDWVIYPEGSMIKTRQLLRGGRLYLELPKRQGPPHTGAAMLALKAEIYRERLHAAIAQGRQEEVHAILMLLGLPNAVALTGEPLSIVPVTVTYYPLRPGPNAALRLLRRLQPNLPARTLEEIEIEGNLLLRDSEINVHFAEPIAVTDYLGCFRTINRFLPFFRPIETNNLLLKADARRLTERAMRSVYTHVLVNYDHLFSAALYQSVESHRPLVDLHRAIGLAVHEIRTRTRRRLHPILGPPLTRLLAGLPYSPAASIEGLAARLGAIWRNGDTVAINHEALERQCDFHAVRTSNPFRVFANELAPLSRVTRLVNLAVNLAPEPLRQKLAEVLVRQDRHAYARDRAAWSGAEMKPPEVGAPFLRHGADGRPGVLLIHGFGGAPGEMVPLANHLEARGCTVYAVRLAGHGTTAADLANQPWEAWYDACIHGLAILRQLTSPVVLAGFSTGGLLALRLAAEAPEGVAGVCAINPPASLRDAKAAKAVPLGLLNSLLRTIGRPVAGCEYRDLEPLHADTHYRRIYVRSVLELGKLMRITRRHLPSIAVPARLIVADADPTVHPRSARRLFARLRPACRELIALPRSRHAIIRGLGAGEVCELVERFVDSVSGGTWSPAGRALARPPAAAPLPSVLPRENPGNSR